LAALVLVCGWSWTPALAAGASEPAALATENAPSATAAETAPTAADTAPSAAENAPSAAENGPSATAADPAPPTQAPPATESAPPAADTAPPTAAAVERLAGLARLWGRVKYFHPYLGYRKVEWDQALVEAVPLVEAATTTEEYRAAVDHMLGFLGDPQTRTLAPGEEAPEELVSLDRPAGGAATTGDGGRRSLDRPAVAAATTGDAGRWSLDDAASPAGDPGRWSLARPSLLAAGGTAAADAPAPPPLPKVEWLDGRVAWIDARNWPQLLAAGPPDEGLLTGAFEEALGGEGIVLDLRGPPAAADSYGAFFLQQSLRADLPLLLTEDLLLPALRQRLHDGYAPQGLGAVGTYSSGFAVREHPVLAAAGKARRRLPLVVLANDSVGGVWDLLAGLQAAGAVLVYQGDRDLLDFSGAVTVVDLPGGVRARVRVAEALSPDGSLAPGADFRLPPPAAGGDEAVDPARELALAVLRGDEHPPARNASPAPSPRQLIEDPYPEMTYPARAYRLLALFRFWNVIATFYPYKELMDRPWDEALADLLPRFAEAADEVGYTLAVAALVARIQDTHGFLLGDAFRRWLGERRPPLEVRFIEGRLAVTAVLDEELVGSGRVRVGDVVLAVDGEEVEARFQRLSPYFAASTPQALRWRVTPWLLAGPQGSEARLRLHRGGGEPLEVSVPRGGLDPAAAEKLRQQGRLPVFTVLPEGYGYLDLTRLERAQVPEAFEAVRRTPALILDMRGYPRGTAWTITPYLAATSATAARFRRKLYVDASEHAAHDYTFEQPFPAGGPWQYAGRLVVLIDERAISQAEHSCLFFESARPDVVFIGSPTNGANGDVTSTLLPGNLRVMFSGHDVRHADGRQLQRVGIQPQVPAAPTLAGLRAGRDEVLEAALAYLARQP
jgi:C-terminal processing protease CtpA/Prc